MAGNASAKGNPASKRMMNPSKKAKRVANKNKNESNKVNANIYETLNLHFDKERFGGLTRAERRNIQKIMNVDCELAFETIADDDKHGRERLAKFLRYKLIEMKKRNKLEADMEAVRKHAEDARKPHPIPRPIDRLVERFSN